MNYSTCLWRVPRAPLDEDDRAFLYRLAEAEITR
jgi:hypothetical protein